MPSGGVTPAGGAASPLAFMWNLGSNAVQISDGAVIHYDTKVFGSAGTDLVNGVFTAGAAHVGVWTFSASIALFDGAPTETGLQLQVIPAIEDNVTPVQLAPWTAAVGADHVAAYSYAMKQGDEVRVLVNHDATGVNRPTLAAGTNTFLAAVYHGPLAT